MRVEISIADNADIAAANEHISFVVRLRPTKGSPLLQEVQLNSLRRTHELIGQHIDALAPVVRKALGSSS